MNYLFLLDEIKAQNFLNEQSSEIFNQNKKITIRSIKRYKTFNEEEALNVLYDLDVDGQPLKLRASTSNFLDKEHDYDAMKYFYENGFAEGQFVVPEPVAYLANEKILFYKNIDGQSFADVLQEEKNEEYVKACSMLVKRVHELGRPSFELFDPKQLFEDFQYQLIMEKFPESANLRQIIYQIRDLLPVKEKKFCHGDFNPNNLLVREKGLALIDFGMTSIFFEEIDLASFIAHLRHELAGDEALFENLSGLFLATYGFYNERTYDLLIALIDARLLEISLKFKASKYNPEFAFQYLKKDLEKVNLVMKNAT